MSDLDSVMEWLTSSEANTARFRKDISVVHEIAPGITEADLVVLRKIREHGMLGGVAPTAEVMGMRSYGWDDQKSPKRR